MKWFLLGSAFAANVPQPFTELLTNNDIRYTVEQAAWLISEGHHVPDDIIHGHSLKSGKAAMQVTPWTLDHDEVADRYKVRYTFEPEAGFTDSEKTKVTNSLSILSADLCVDFIHVETPSEEDFQFGVVKFIDSTGCWSNIGRSWSAHQTGQSISLKRSVGCVDQGVIIHEMIHALGFHHEQTRPDRDPYVIIHEENVIREPTDYLHNFQKISESQHNQMTESPFDFWSIMQYNSYSFTSNGEPTITDVDGNVMATQQYRPSSMDIYQLCKMYTCTTCAGETEYLSTDGVTLPKMYQCSGMSPPRYFWASRCNDGWRECLLNNDDEEDDCPRPKPKVCCNKIVLNHVANPEGVNGEYVRQSDTFNNAAYYKNEQTGYYLYQYIGNQNWHISTVLDNATPVFWHSSVDDDGECPEEGKRWHSWSPSSNEWVYDQHIRWDCIIPTTSPTTTSMTTQGPTVPPGDCCKCFQFSIEEDASGNQWNLEFCYTGQFLAGAPVFKNDLSGMYIYVWDENMNWHVNQELGAPSAHFFAPSNQGTLCPTHTNWYMPSTDGWVQTDDITVTCNGIITLSSTTSPTSRTVTEQTCDGWTDLKSKKKTTFHLESQHSKIYRYQLNETPDNKDYSIFVTFLKKNCGQDFLDGFASGRLSFEAFDKGPFYRTRSQYSYADNVGATVQFYSFGLKDADNLGNSKKDVFYFQISGIDQIDFKKKDPYKCLKWVKVAYRDVQPFEGVEDWAQCYHENYLSIKAWFKG